MISSSDFVDLVIDTVPEADSTVREHLDDNEGELLLHLLVADLRRLAVAWFDVGATDALARLLAVVDTGLSEGDDQVENAVAVSFVEDAAWWDSSSQAFIATWPLGPAEEMSVSETLGRKAHPGPVRLTLGIVRNPPVVRCLDVARSRYR